MLVRYRYRTDPTSAQRQALARAFGCAGVVYNDALVVTVIREPDGRYYASFVVERDPTPLPPVSRTAGIDLGLVSFATIAASDGTIENAARNILVAAGLAETLNACGDHVRPEAALAVVSEAGTHRGAAWAISAHTVR